MSLNNQVAAIDEADNPAGAISLIAEQVADIEAQIKKCLALFTNQNEIGKWCKGILGIGPVIAAGLFAHIDIAKAKSAASIWRFAGLDPTQTWEKGKSRPWNADLKGLCWNIGECFVKVSGNPKSLYGRLYKERKAAEVKLNDEGAFREQVTKALARRKYGQSTEVYKAHAAGKLPKAHIHARAKRYAVKMFLSHYWEALYFFTYHKEAPPPYIIVFGGHKDYISWKEAL